MTKEQRLLKQARAIAATDVNWAGLSNALFDQQTGILAGQFPSSRERRRFMQTPEFQEIRQLIADAMKRTGVIAGATPRKSGKFVVRMPVSLHAALEREASHEGVSLNQLVVAKLAVQLKTVSAGNGRIRAPGKGPPRRSGKKLASAR